jgi:hypothetical protein
VGALSAPACERASAMFENPESRRYKEKHEYQNLFRFGKKGADGRWQQLD